MIVRQARSFALTVFLAAAPLAAQAPTLTVHTIFGSREFASDLVSVAWMKDGTAFSTLDTDSAGQTDLYRVDASSGKKQLLLRGSDLVPPGGSKAIRVESYRFSGDGAKLLVFTNSARVWRQNTKGTYYVWDFTAKRLLPVSAKPGYQMFAKFSPDGRRVGFVRDNNLYVADLAAGPETALTPDRGGDGHNRTPAGGYRGERDPA